MLGVTIIVLIVYLSLTAHPPAVLKLGFEYDKLGHTLAYGVLMAWFTQLVESRAPRIYCALLSIALGILMEWLQSKTGYRTAELGDALADSAGVLLGWWLSAGPLAGVIARLDRFFDSRLNPVAR